jgi:hypothetical protein
LPAQSGRSGSCFLARISAAWTTTTLALFVGPGLHAAAARADQPSSAC